MQLVFCISHHQKISILQFAIQKMTDSIIPVFSYNSFYLRKVSIVFLYLGP